MKHDMHAFPVSASSGVHQSGLTKRELFAAMAMQGLCTRDDLNDSLPAWQESYGVETLAEGVADQAMHIADALLAALEKSPETYTKGNQKPGPPPQENNT